MALFSFGNNREPQGMAAMRETPTPAEPLTIFIEYHDGSTERIDVTYNLQELQRNFSMGISDGAGFSFELDQPITINPRYIKKVTFVKRQ